MPSRTGELFPPKPRRPYRRLLIAVDSSVPGDEDERGARVVLECMRCHCRLDWQWRTAAELRAGIPCPRCNPLLAQRSQAASSAPPKSGHR